MHDDRADVQIDIRLVRVPTRDTPQFDDSENHVEHRNQENQFARGSLVQHRAGHRRAILGENRQSEHPLPERARIAQTGQSPVEPVSGE